MCRRHSAGPIQKRVISVGCGIKGGAWRGPFTALTFDDTGVSGE